LITEPHVEGVGRVQHASGAVLRTGEPWQITSAMPTLSVPILNQFCDIGDYGAGLTTFSYFGNRMRSTWLRTRDGQNL